MPSERQTKAAAKVLQHFGYAKAKSFIVARAVLVEVENLDCGDFFNDWPRDYVEIFWAAYPHRIGKGKVVEELDKIHKVHETPWVELMRGLERYVDYVNATPDLSWCYPATWLHQKRWLDDFASPKQSSKGSNGFAAIARQGV